MTSKDILRKFSGPDIENYDYNFEEYIDKNDNSKKKSFNEKSSTILEKITSDKPDDLNKADDERKIFHHYFKLT